jgi:hypothetical protein
MKSIRPTVAFVLLVILASALSLAAWTDPMPGCYPCASGPCPKNSGQEFRQDCYHCGVIPLFQGFCSYGGPTSPPSLLITYGACFQQVCYRSAPGCYYPSDCQSPPPGAWLMN